MAIGIRTFKRLQANAVFTNDAVAATLDNFSFPVVSGVAMYLKGVLFLTTGATGGIRLLVNSPGSSLYTCSFTIIEDDATVVESVITAQATFTNALANAGNHVLFFNAAVVANATGNLTIQAAQNTADPLSLTVLAGSMVDAVQL